MIWKNEKNKILENIIVEEIFRDKTGIKIYFGSLKDRPNEKVLLVVKNSKELITEIFESNSSRFYYPSISHYYNSCLMLLENKVSRRWFLKRARILRFGEKVLSDFLKSGYILDWNKIIEYNDNLNEARCSKIFSILDLNLKELTPEYLKELQELESQEINLSKKPKIIVKYFNGKYWSYKTVTYIDIRDGKIYESCNFREGLGFGNYIDLLRPNGEKCWIILNTDFLELIKNYE